MTCARRAKELRYLLEFLSRRCTNPVAYRKGGERPQAAPGLPRRVPGQRGAARPRSTPSPTRLLAERAAFRPLRCWPWVEIAAKLTLSQAEARAEFRRPGSAGSPARQARSASVVLLEGRLVKIFATLQTSRAASARRPRPSTWAYLSRAADGLPDAALGSGPAGRGQLPVPDQAAGSRAAARRSSAAPRPSTTRSRAPTSTHLDPAPPPNFTYPQTWTCSSAAPHKEAHPQSSPQLLRPLGRRVRPRVSLIARRASRWSRRTSCTPPTCCWLPLIPTTLSVRTAGPAHRVSWPASTGPPVRRYGRSSRWSTAVRSCNQEITKDLTTERGRGGGHPDPRALP